MFIVLRMRKTTLIIVMCYGHESCAFCVDFQKRLLLREMHHIIILTIITDTIIPVYLERH
jgi:hypothetical protein